jgi:hypothetical protein
MRERKKRERMIIIILHEKVMENYKIKTCPKAGLPPEEEGRGGECKAISYF